MKIIVNITLSVLFILFLYGCNESNPISESSTNESFNHQISDSNSLLKGIPIESDEFHLISPEDNTQTTNHEVTFSWDKWQMSGYVEFGKYEISISNTTGGSGAGTIITNVNTTSCTFTLETGIYEWTVTVSYWATAYTPWVYVELPYVETWTFIVAVQPAVPIVHSTTYNNHPKIYWDPVAYADGYRIIKYIPYTGIFYDPIDITDNYYVDESESIFHGTGAHDVSYLVISFNMFWTCYPGWGMSDTFSVISNAIKRED